MGLAHYRNVTRSSMSNAMFAFKFHSRFSASVSSVTSKDEQPMPVSAIPEFKIRPLLAIFVALFKKVDPKELHMLWLERKNKLGPIFQLKIPFNPKWIAIFNPDDLEKLYRATSKNPVRLAFHSLKKVRDEATDNYFENKGGLLVENHEEWRRVRSKVQTPMMRPKNLIKYLPQMDQVTLQFMDRISDLQKKHGEMPSNFLQEIYKWALESVSLIALSRRFGCLDPNLSLDSPQVQLINSVNGVFRALAHNELSIPMWRIYPTASYRKLVKCHEVFLRVADEAIRETEEALKTKSLDEFSMLEHLLLMEGLSRKDVVTIILDMLFAGIDTTSHSIAFILYCLARNPNVQQKLQAEVDAVLGNGEGPMTESHLARLSYLKLCVKEAMRRYPLVIGHARFLEEDLVLSGYLIPKGMTVIAINAVTSIDENLFPRAKEYLPERWSRSQPLGPIHPFASLPFSHGPRMCIGRRIAEQEMYTFIARTVHRFEIDYKYDDIDIVAGLVSTPSQPLRFEFKERRKS